MVAFGGAPKASPNDNILTEEEEQKEDNRLTEKEDLGLVGAEEFKDDVSLRPSTMTNFSPIEEEVPEVENSHLRRLWKTT